MQGHFFETVHVSKIVTNIFYEHYILDPKIVKEMSIYFIILQMNSIRMKESF